ncbi:HdeD family acid-resistance protein [Natrarchaeobius sp. A-rgal3]|uniref:HdeD family acid-resistance protein n=1 Tax=Natrarchaeobius versutus TaxID=1679078 RepID=UPI00351023EB
MNSVTATDESYGYSLERGWRTLAIAGGVIGLIGLLAVAFPVVTGLSVTVGLGLLLVIGGIVHGAHAFTARGWSGSLWQVALAVVSIVAGAILLVNPVVGLVTLTILVIAYLLVDAVAELWMAMRMDDQPGRASVAASGILSLVLAGLLWIGFPADASWAIGVLVGIGLLATGLSMVVVAITGRNAAKSASAATEPRSA